MPQTSLAGGVLFGERLLDRTSTNYVFRRCVVAGGVVEVQAADDEEKLLSRADSAVYSARSKGYSCLYQHNGKTIRAHERGLDSVADSEVAPVEKAQ